MNVNSVSHETVLLTDRYEIKMHNDYSIPNHAVRNSAEIV